MLKKADILRELNRRELDRSRYWLTAGGALTLYGLREQTQDIDLGCEPSLADELEAAGVETTVKDDGLRKLHIPPYIDLFEDWGRGAVRLAEGIPTVSLADLLALKRQLGREKDRADITALERALGVGQPPMRRAERAVTDPARLRQIIDGCRVLRLGMSAGDVPYVVPMNFGYRCEAGQYTFYVHCAGEGRKLELLAKNPIVCVELDCGHALTEAETPCGYGYHYQSVIAQGVAQILDDPEEKKRGLERLMHHQTGETFAFTDQQAAAVTVCAVTVTQLSGKERMQ